MTRGRPEHGYEGYERYGQPSPRVRAFAAHVARAIRDGDTTAAQAAIDRALESLRAASHSTTQTPAPTGEGTERGRPAADWNTP